MSRGLKATQVNDAMHACIAGSAGLAASSAATPKSHEAPGATASRGVPGSSPGLAIEADQLKSRQNAA